MGSRKFGYGTIHAGGKAEIISIHNQPNLSTHRGSIQQRQEWRIMTYLVLSCR